VARHIFQAWPVWIYTQSNITQASYSPEYITPTQQISKNINVWIMNQQLMLCININCKILGMYRIFHCK
jgi:hypothetical protein